MLTIALDTKGRRVHVDATRGRRDYFCPACGAPLVARKGKVVRHHFAHKGGTSCADSWEDRYDDSAWHDSWQERFPEDNREVTLDLDGTRHRADVLAGRTVVEFQGGAISARHFNDRCVYYQKLGYKVAWLFDLRDEYAKGSIKEAGRSGKRAAFTWDSPLRGFGSYDATAGNIDLYFQLKEEDAGQCIVRVAASAEGYSRFEAVSWTDAAGFLADMGLVAGSCPPPDLSPLSSDPRFLAFKERYGITLNAQQERAAQAVEGATLLLAVPGSGKTTTLVARLGYLVAHLGVPPEAVVALTYTRSAAFDMRERFASTFGDPGLAGRIRFSTINALAYAICREWYGACGLSVPRQIEAGEKAKLLREIIKRATGEYASEWDVISLDHAIGLVKNGMWTDAQIAEASAAYEHFQDMYSAYQEHLADNDLMDFDDQMVYALRILSSDPALLGRYRARYRYWFVDEAQDTSRLQHNLIYRLVGSRGNLFMVGDEDQSIYGFRGAYPEAMFGFRHVYADSYVLKMERNYRSRSEVVNAARGFISANKGRFDKDMTAERGPGGEVSAIDVATRRDQYEALYRAVRASSGRTAVLYRDNDAAVPLLDRLLREEVPFKMLSGKKTYFDSSAVRDVKAFLSLAQDPTDAASFMRVYMKAACYVRKEDAQAACKLAARGGRGVLAALVDASKEGSGGVRAVSNAREFAALVSGLRGLAPAQAIDALLEGGYGEYLDERRMRTDKVDLLRPVAEREQTIGSFLERLGYLESAFGTEGAHAESDDLVLASVHSSKGLEFDNVIVVDAVDGVFPSTPKNPKELARDSATLYQEERRLFYVAVTRARESVKLIRPLESTTSFIDELLPREVDATCRGRRDGEKPRAKPPAGFGVCIGCGDVLPVKDLSEIERSGYDGDYVTGTCRSCYSKAVMGMLKRRAGRA